MTVYTLPRANAPIAGTDAPTIQWYNFLRYLDTRTATASGDVQAEITTIAEKLGSPDGSVDNIPPLSSIRGRDGARNRAERLRASFAGARISSSPTPRRGSLSQSKRSLK